jgi:methyl-accepting chemotaxis protein
MRALAPDLSTRHARSSLRTKAAVRVALLAAAVIFATGGLYFVQVKGALEDQLAKHGRALVRSIGLRSELALFSGRAKEAAEAIDPFFRSDDEIVYILLVDKDERVILSRVRRGHRELSPAELLRIHRAIGAGPIDIQEHIRSFPGGILGFTETVQVRRNETPLEPLYEEEAPPRAAPDGGTVAGADGGAAWSDGGVAAQVSAPVPSRPPVIPERARRAADAEERALGMEPSAASPIPEDVGRILLGLSKEPLENRVWALARVAFGVGLGAVVVLLLALYGASQRVFRRIERMVTVAHHISRGDLTHKIEVRSDDELGLLGEALNRITTNLGRVLARVQAVTGHLTRAVDTISLTSAEVVSGAQVQSDAVAKTQAAVEVMSGNVSAIAKDVDVLSEAARQSAAAIQEMTRLNQEVLQQVVSMTQSVDETTSSLEEMARSVREVAHGVQNQTSEAARTSRSMVDMDLAIREVQATANESAELSETVRHDAELGAESVGRVLRGITRIEHQSRDVLKAMATLDHKVRSIGNILSLIDEIAEQVNLLSLNAAIIAAQAGEHGRAFAVVADEIKELAERTTASTREIGELVKAIQSESQNAAHEVSQAARNIEGGVRLTGQAEMALSKILESAARGASMAKNIARATLDQARGSDVVTQAARRIAEAVSDVAAATSQQARSSDLITRSAQQMREITLSVDSSCHAEAVAADDVSRALERIASMVDSLHATQHTQARSAEDVRGAIENIRRVAEGHRDSMATLQRAIQTLSAQSKALETELERFTV